MKKINLKYLRMKITVILLGQPLYQGHSNMLYIWKLMGLFKNAYADMYVGSH